MKLNDEIFRTKYFTPNFGLKKLHQIKKIHQAQS